RASENRFPVGISGFMWASARFSRSEALIVVVGTSRLKATAAFATSLRDEVALGDFIAPVEDSEERRTKTRSPDGAFVPLAFLNLRLRFAQSPADLRQRVGGGETPKARPLRRCAPRPHFGAKIAAQRERLRLSKEALHST